MTISALYEIYLQFPQVETDTRKLKSGSIFFALRGPRFNANEMAAEALEKGAEYAVIDDPAFAHLDKTILVDDVLRTLQELAGYHRETFRKKTPKVPFIGITGSNGKTTTKELIHEVLSSQYKTYTTEGNLNNHIGIPLTLLRVREDAEVAIIEMGANHQKEIEGYCRYTQPDYGLITNCGKAHLEGFGGVEGVKKGKGELYDYLRNTKGTIFIMNDYDYLQKMSAGIEKIIRYGTNTNDKTLQTSGKIYASDPFLSVVLEDNTILKTQLVGDYNLPNVLSAVSIGRYFHVPMEKIKNAIESYAPGNSRSQLIAKGQFNIVLDAYNANPTSMRAAIENFAKTGTENKILFLGAMAELGEESLQEHSAIVALIKEHQWLAVALVGAGFEAVQHPYQQFKRVEDLLDWVKKQEFPPSSLLIKGSRSMAMEKVLDGIVP